MPTGTRPAAFRTAAISLLGLTLLGCATVPPAERNPRDPWQRVNRGVFKFNEAFDRAIFKPVARTYLRAPQVIRTGIGNFFNNLSYPGVILNAALQGQPKAFARDTGRFVVNSTIGIGGLLDPATSLGLTLEDRDFGQTFGKWGVPSGPFVELPLLGPSDVRDAIGLVPEEYVDPRHYIRNPYWDYGLAGLDAVKTRADYLPLTDMAEQNFDPYAFERNAYLQERDFKVKGAAPPNKNSAEEELKELQQQ